MNEDEVRKALKELRTRQGQEDLTGETNPSGGFEPTGQIEEILATAKELSRRYGILLPPPFNPFESLPKIPASRRENDSVDRLERLPKITETPKPEPQPLPKPQRSCLHCGTLNDLGSLYCQHCGSFLRRPVEPDRGYEMRR